MGVGSTSSKTFQPGDVHMCLIPLLSPQLHKTMADMLLSLEGGAENRCFWVQVYLITALHKALRIIFRNCERGPSKCIPNAFSGELRSILPIGLVHRTSVTLVVTYERRMEEDLVDGTFKRQMIPSALSSVHPSLSILLSKLLKPSRP